MEIQTKTAHYGSLKENLFMEDELVLGLVRK